MDVINIIFSSSSSSSSSRTILIAFHFSTHYSTGSSVYHFLFNYHYGSSTLQSEAMMTYNRGPFHYFVILRKLFLPPRPSCMYSSVLLQLYNATSNSSTLYLPIVFTYLRIPNTLSEQIHFWARCREIRCDCGKVTPIRCLCLQRIYYACDHVSVDRNEQNLQRSRIIIIIVDKRRSATTCIMNARNGHFFLFHIFRVLIFHRWAAIISVGIISGMPFATDYITPMNSCAPPVRGEASAVGTLHTPIDFNGVPGITVARNRGFRRSMHATFLKYHHYYQSNAVRWTARVRIVYPTAVVVSHRPGNNTRETPTHTPRNILLELFTYCFSNVSSVLSSVR